MVDKGSERELWLALFNADTEEEMEELATTGGNVMSEAVKAYRVIAASDEFKYLA